MIEILNRYTRLVLYTSATADTIAAAVVEAREKGAHLRGAHLRGADLQGAYLRGAYLQGADLRGAIGLLPDGLTPLQIGGTRHWVIVRQPGYITIGCHHQMLTWWREHYLAMGRKEEYSDAEIAEYAAHIEYCAQWMAAHGVLEVIAEAA